MTSHRRLIQARQKVRISESAKNRSCIPGSRNGMIAPDSAAAATRDCVPNVARRNHTM